MKNANLFLLIITLILLLTACKKDDNKPGDNNLNFHEEELITSVLIIAHDSSRNVTDTIVYRDTDGIGGQLPSIDTLFLRRNTNYSMNVKFLDESNSEEIKDISLEIEDEGDEHLICYQLHDLTGIYILIEDTDGMFPLGLQSAWTVDSTAQSNNGSLELLLKHQPGVKNGSCEVGDTDVEVNFPIIFQ